MSQMLKLAPTAVERQHREATTVGRVTWLAMVLLVTVQHSAFIYLPAMLSGQDYLDFGIEDNPINGISVGLSAAVLAALMLPRITQVAAALVRSPTLTVYMLLVIVSVVWSVHPDLTIKRAAGYVVTMGVAVTLATIAGFRGSMGILSASLTVSALCSFAFCVLFPSYGIMATNNELSSTWRGVFTHKEIFGIALTFAILVRCSIILFDRRVSPWSWGTILLLAFLVVMTRSATALIISAFALSVTGILILRLRDQVLATISLLGLLAVGLCIAYAAWIDSGWVLGLFGKDASLTGRVELWQHVLEMIGKHPFLGWGYRATWIISDPEVMYVDYAMGWHIVTAENSYLEMWLELGIVGLAMLLAILIRAAHLAQRAMRAGLWAEGVTMMMLVVVLLTAGQVVELVGINQHIAWLTFLVVMFNLELGRYGRS